jgi:hypothetical protein
MGWVLGLSAGFLARVEGSWCNDPPAKPGAEGEDGGIEGFGEKAVVGSGQRAVGSQGGDAGLEVSAGADGGA